MSKTAGIVVIGNEILSGRTRDENAAYFLKELRSLGVDVRRVSVIPDELPAIRDEIRSGSIKFDYVFSSGGVGPTHDDVTIAGIAAAFERGICRSPELETTLRGYYQENLTDAMLRMANVPEGFSLVQDSRMWFPVILVENVYIFPGVPEILASKFEHIKEIFREDPYFTEDVFSDCGGRPYRRRSARSPGKVSRPAPGFLSHVHQSELQCQTHAGVQESGLPRWGAPISGRAPGRTVHCSALSRTLSFQLFSDRDDDPNMGGTGH